MELGVHLPLMEWQGEGQSLTRLQATVDAARDHGFDTISVNDHFVFSTPWLDGLTALAAVVERSGEMRLATTISLASLRGPAPLAKAIAALDILSDGRMIAGVGPGSSQLDYEAIGMPFDERWPRFEEAVRVLRTLLRGEPAPQGETRFYPVSETPLAPPPRRDGGVPLWIGSWGSEPGLRRVARLADGWLASAYNTTPEMFAAARELLGTRAGEARPRRGAIPELAGDDVDLGYRGSRGGRPDADRRARAGAQARPRQAASGLCIGSAEHCAELLSRYAAVGCERVLFWPLGDEPSQIERLATSVRPLIGS